MLPESEQHPVGCKHASFEGQAVPRGPHRWSVPCPWRWQYSLEDHPQQPCVPWLGARAAPGARGGGDSSAVHAELSQRVCVSKCTGRGDWKHLEERAAQTVSLSEVSSR